MGFFIASIFIYLPMLECVIECCANSIESAVAGELGGANRIEFCTNLESGGTTPTKEDIIKLTSIINIPIRVLIRPRAGNFVYSKEEIAQMLADIKFVKKLGCEGIVIGALNKDNSINKEQTLQLVNAAKPMHVTFHRAFDEGNNLKENLEDVISCGCDTLLTAGQANKVKEGMKNLKQLVDLAKKRIIILAGSGVNHNNIEELYTAGIRNFHLSGTIKNKKGILKTDSLLIKKAQTKLSQIV